MLCKVFRISLSMTVQKTCSPEVWVNQVDSCLGGKSSHLPAHIWRIYYMLYFQNVRKFPFIYILSLYTKDCQCWLLQSWRGCLQGRRHYFQYVSTTESESHLGWSRDSKVEIIYLQSRNNVSTLSRLSGEPLGWGHGSRPVSLVEDDPGFRLCLFRPLF